MPSLPPRLLPRWAAYQAAFSAAGLAVWMGDSFGPTSLEQILWHLRYSEGAAVKMGSMFLFDFCFQVLVFPCLFAVIAALVHTAAALYLRHWPRRVLKLAPAAAGCVALSMLLAQFSAVSYAAAQFGPDRFAEQFVDPARALLQPRGPRRNLVLVYVESLEQAYGDEDLFGRDLLSSLHGLGGVSFPDYRPMPGATWTMAAMVATQCGVPLKVYSEGDVRKRPGRKAFLPGATCLGDILHAHGYQNVFLGGAPLSFAGKGAFLRDHGYDEAWGREEWARRGLAADELNEWGLADSALFARARVRLDELHASGRPFNLTLLTMDTHNPHGFQSRHCREQGARDFEGIVQCADRQVAAFLAQARAKGFLKDTVFVVLGDHLAFPNPAWDSLQRAGDSRRMFNLFLGENLPPPNTTQILPFDLFPTLVELAGIEVAGDRLGLGEVAFGPVEAPRSPQRAENWSLAAVRGSSRYDRLWQEQAPPLPVQPERIRSTSALVE